MRTHLAESSEIKDREQQEAMAMMMGRVSYEAFAPVWPGAAPGSPPVHRRTRFGSAICSLADCDGDVALLGAADDR
jgi:hypothetical protein